MVRVSEGARIGGRERVRAAALELFLEHGFEATSMQQIADRAEVAKSLLHYHFDGKVALLTELVEPFLEASERAVAELWASGAPLEEVLSRYLDVVLAHRDEVSLLNVDVSSREHAGLGSRYDQVQAAWRRLVSDDDVLATATLGALTRPVVHGAEPDLHRRHDDLVTAAVALVGSSGA